MGLIDVVEKKFFYRDSMRAAIKVALVSMLINIILAVALVFAVQIKPSRVYFATNLHGGIVELTPLSVPMVSSQGLLDWSNKTIVSMYAYDFVHYKEQIGGLKDSFTDKGFAGFLSSIDSSGVLDTIKKSRMVVSAVPQGAPVIESEGMINGVYTWRISEPILIAYQSSSEKADRKKLVTITVQRMSTIDRESVLAVNAVNETTTQ